VIAAPSGAGKTSLVKALMEREPRMRFSVSYATRAARPNEVEGRDYHFVTRVRFEEMAARGEFLEHARVFGRHQYGTPRRWLEEAQRRGLDLVLEIDVQGAEQVKQKLPAAVAIFILPPAKEELERRLRARGQDSDEAIGRRLERARQEIQRYAEYDFLVVNDDVERAGREIQAITVAARCLRSCLSERACKILESFGG
jgi:guanylate kinase